MLTVVPVPLNVNCLNYRCSHYWFEWCFPLSTKHFLSKHFLTISWRSLHPAGVYANKGCWLQYTKHCKLTSCSFCGLKESFHQRNVKFQREKKKGNSLSPLWKFLPQRSGQIKISSAFEDNSVRSMGSISSAAPTCLWMFILIMF